MLVSAAGFEPTAPGFIPLQLSPPLPEEATFVVWTVPSPWIFANPKVLPVQSLHLPGKLRAWLGIGTTREGQAFPDFEQIHHAVSPHGAQLFRNPVLYPAELRGHTLPV